MLFRSVIVNITQCLNGSVSPLYAPATILGRAGVVFGQDLTSEAALTKLAYLLALPNATPEDVAKRMSVSIRGELTETTRTHFEHPGSGGTLTPEISTLTASFPSRRLYQIIPLHCSCCLLDGASAAGRLEGSSLAHA